MQQPPKEDNPTEWHPQQEHILKTWAETAQVYSLMHDSAHRRFRLKSWAFTIPVIVLSSITGTANFATNSFDPDHRYKLSMVIGCLNLGAGLITTLAQFLRVNELMEGHRAAMIAFSKFSRTVSITLSLPLYDRQTSGNVFLESCRQEYDRLLDAAPVIPIKIVEAYKKQIGESNFRIPCFGIQPIHVYTPSMDSESAERALGTMRNSLMRLRSVRAIDEATADDIEMRLVASGSETDDEEKGDRGRTCCENVVCIPTANPDP